MPQIPSLVAVADSQHKLISISLMLKNCTGKVTAVNFCKLVGMFGTLMENTRIIISLKVKHPALVKL